MKPLLYYDEISPPVRSVLLLIKSVQMEVDLVLVYLFNNAKHEDDYQKLNPCHAVPTLKHDDLVLTDSHAILIYLTELSDKPFSLNLYPVNSRDRIMVLNRLFFNGSFLFRRDSEIMTNLIKYRTMKLEEYQKIVYECYDTLETYLASSKFMACDQLTLADFSIVATLSTLDILFPIDGVTQTNWKKLSAWFHGMKSLSYYNEANQRGLDRLRHKIGQYCKIN